jgi:hypothetical protein
MKHLKDQVEAQENWLNRYRGDGDALVGAHHCSSTLSRALSLALSLVSGAHLILGGFLFLSNSAYAVTARELMAGWNSSELSTPAPTQGIAQLAELASEDSEVQAKLTEVLARYHLPSVTSLFTGETPLISVCTADDLRTGLVFFHAQTQLGVRSLYPPSVSVELEADFQAAIQRSFEHVRRVRPSHEELHLAQRPRACLRSDSTLLSAYANFVERLASLAAYEPFEERNFLAYATIADYVQARLDEPSGALQINLAKVRAERRLIRRSQNLQQIRNEGVEATVIQSPTYAFFDQDGNLTDRAGFRAYLENQGYLAIYTADFGRRLPHRLNRILQLEASLANDQRPYAQEGLAHAPRSQRRFYQGLSENIERALTQLRSERCELVSRFASSLTQAPSARVIRGCDAGA